MRNITQAATGTPGPCALMFKLAYSEARDVSVSLPGASWAGALRQCTTHRVEERLRTLSPRSAAGTSQIQPHINRGRLPASCRRKKSWE